MGWFTGVAIAATITVLAVGGVLWPLGHLLIEEFTRPGVTIEQGTPQWGDWAFPEAVEEPLKDSRRTVTFQAADEVLLRGEFWAQKCGAPTIIVSHGFHLPSRYFRSVAALEYAYGANVLLFDYRGHGESSLVPTTCGNAEVNDLLAAVEVAARQRETMRGKVYVHGFSMGAAVALLLPAHPALAGIIADSPYARLDEMICMLIQQLLVQETTGWWHGLKRAVCPLFPVLARLMLFSGRLWFRVRYHQSLIARPDQAIGSKMFKQERQTSDLLPPRLLFIHAENDPFITLHHTHRLVTIAHAAGRSIQVYYTSCAIHCGSYGHDPQQYMTLLQRFVAL